MSALVLKIIACAAMLSDHIGIVFNLLPLRIIGRIAFPIFLYLICNGFFHTSNRLKYAGRLGLFALISQIPFSLLCYNEPFYGKGNVFFTLFLALICLWIAEEMKRHRILRYFCLTPFAIVFLICQLGLLSIDYGTKAPLFMTCFMLFCGEKPWQKILLVLSCLGVCYYSMLCKIALSILSQDTFPSFEMWTLLQGFAIFGIVLTLFYNGKKGGEALSKKAAGLTKISFYVFYPAHMLLLYLVRLATA